MLFRSGYEFYCLKGYLKKLFIVLFLTIYFPFLKIAQGQNSSGLNAPYSFQYYSSYEWQNESTLKFSFYAFRPCFSGWSVPSRYFPDTCFLKIFFNKKIVMANILAFRDSSFDIPYSQCSGKKSCSDGSLQTGTNYSIYRYSGTIDFSKQKIRDTLDKLNACLIDIAFAGVYDYNDLIGNFAPASPNDTLFGYLTLNRCFKWKKGDKSPEYKSHYFLGSHNSIDKAGVHQIDFGVFPKKGDSISYHLSQPKKYRDGSSYPFRNPYSLSYYTTSYCPSGGSCLATPKSNPPKGFSLNPKTGVSMHYLQKPLVLKFPVTNNDAYPTFATETRLYKLDSLGKMVHVSSQQRIQYFYYLPVDSNVNRPAFVKDLNYFYNVCEENVDTITFRILDTAAINQTISDTADFKIINDLPGSAFFVTNPGNPQPEIKLAYNPPKNSYLSSPYAFNVYSNEKLCSPNRRYIFRSAEFTVIPKPKFKIQVDTSLCGNLKFKAINLLGSGSYKYQWMVYNSIDTIFQSSKAIDSIILPYSGKWFIGLKVENAQYGCSDVFLDSIMPINAGIKTSISSIAKKVCKGKEVNFQLNINNAVGKVSYQWYKNSMLVSDSTNYVANIIDTFNIKLIVSDLRNCFAKDSLIITPFTEQKTLKIKDTAICYKSSIILFAKPSASTDSLTWLFNSNHNINQIIQNPGDYVIQYTDSHRCSVFDTVTVRQVPDLINKRFNDTILCKGDSVSFKFTQASGVVYDSVSWANNGVKINSNVLSIKVNVSSKNILSVWGNLQNTYCKQSDTINISVFPDSIVFCQIKILDSCLNKNLTEVTVTGAASGVSEVNWDDGESNNFTSSIQHNYMSSGSFKVGICVSDINNCKDTFSETIKILNSPKIDFKINDSIQCLKGNKIILSTFSNPSNLTHQINWDDNSFSKLKGNAQIFHSFDSIPNNETIRNIRVSASINSCKDTATSQVVLYPDAEMKIDINGICLGDSTYLSYSQLNFTSIDQINWFVDNNSASASNIFAHWFSDKQIHLVKLQLKTDKGCESNTIKLIQMIDKPVADFTYTKMGKDANGYLFYFLNQSRNSNKWNWQFDVFDSSEIKNPHFVFSDTGFTLIRLIAINQNICFDTTEQLIPIYDKIEIYFPNVFSPDNNKINDGFGVNSSQLPFIKEFHIKIFNRWGEKVFESDNPNELWNPEKSFLGVYIYKGYYRDVYNILKEFKGVIEIID
jgi:hypothetical protein